MLVVCAIASIICVLWSVMDRPLLGDPIHVWRRSESSVEIVSVGEGRPASLIVVVGSVRDEGVSEPDGGGGRHVVRLWQAGHGEAVWSEEVEVGDEDVI